MKSKRQTMSKVAREREVRVRRAAKLEKKYAAAAERKAKAEGATSPTNEGAYGVSSVTNTEPVSDSATGAAEPHVPPSPT
jgi:hypothetical protein